MTSSLGHCRSEEVIAALRSKGEIKPDKEVWQHVAPLFKSLVLMTQLERITHMESLLDRGAEVVLQFEKAMENMAAIRPVVAELEAYYSSPEWRADLEADEAGLLPHDLKRGVLSEDGIYNLLEEYRRLSMRLNHISQHGHYAKP